MPRRAPSVRTRTPTAPPAPVASRADRDAILTGPPPTERSFPVPPSAGHLPALAGRCRAAARVRAVRVAAAAVGAFPLLAPPPAPAADLALGPVVRTALPG